MANREIPYKIYLSESEIPTAWYNPEGKPLPEGLRIDFDLGRLDQVPALL